MLSPADFDLMIEERERRWAVARRVVTVLFVLLCLVGGTIALLVYRQFTRQWAAVSRLKAVGLTVTWLPDGETDGKGGARVSVFRAASDSRATDQDLEALRHINHLEQLDLARCPSVTDAGMKWLAGLVTLRGLYFKNADSSGPNITDAGLTVLETLPRLQILSLAGTHVTNAGLVHVHGMQELELLDLKDTAVTDAGLSVVKTLPKLTALRLEGTSVSPAALAALRKERPSLVIYDDFTPVVSEPIP